MLMTLRRQVATWVAPPDPLDDLDRHVWEDAQTFVREAERLADVSGEYKRHQVYAQLQQRYPRVRKRRLALVLEHAVHEVLG